MNRVTINLGEYVKFKTKYAKLKKMEQDYVRIKKIEKEYLSMKSYLASCYPEWKEELRNHTSRVKTKAATTETHINCLVSKKSKIIVINHGFRRKLMYLRDLDLDLNLGKNK